MNTIKTEILKEGMRFSSPLLFDDGKNMFLAERKILRKFHLDTIRRWKISHLLTHGKEILTDEEAFDNNIAELEELEDEENIISTTSPISKEYIEAIKNIELIFTAHKDGQFVDKTIIDNTVKIVYKIVTDERYLAAGLILTGIQNHLPLAISAVNVAILSAIMGIDLSFPSRNLLQLITAALLHDLEMMSIPDRIINKKGRLTVEEFEILKIHPLKTAQTVTEVFMYPKEIASILMQHHERWDGTGYPEGRKEQNIDPAARILSVVDAFEAMISEKTYRNSMIAYDAVKNLLADKEKRFDPMTLKGFIKSIGVYPVGSYVLLNDLSVAKVMEGNQDSPFMPTVKAIHSKASKLAKDAVVNLKLQKEVFIVRAIAQNELDSLR